MSAPYVDAYGETDDGLTRGNPLKLDRNMFEYLRQIWFNHDVATKVTRWQCYKTSAHFVTNLHIWQAGLFLSREFFIEGEGSVLWTSLY